MSEINALANEPWRAPSPLPSCEETVRSQQPGRRLSPQTRWHPGLGLPGLQNCKNKFLLFISHPVFGILLQPPGHSKLVLHVVGVIKEGFLAEVTSEPRAEGQ